MSGGLREASETTRRERERLETGSGWKRLGLKVVYLGSEDAARAGLRYRPVAWLAISLVAVAFFFPGRRDAAPARAAFVPAPFAPARSTTTSTSVSMSTMQVPTPPTTPIAPAATFTSPPVTSFVPSPAPPTATPVSTPSALVVRGFGWASSLSGIPNNGVPDGTMPVGNRLGNIDKESFVRLIGTASTLTLHEDSSGAREAIGAGAVRACRILDAAWEETPDQALADAPAWDPAACANGVEQDDTWTFDLSGFDEVTGQAGFVLVPSPDAPADFQLTFAAS